MWSAKFKRCVKCKTTKVRHMARGFCRRCYLQNYRNDARNADRIERSKRDWYLAKRPEQLEARRERRERVHFDGKRTKALERDGHACVRCGNDQQLTVHHKDRNGRGSSKPNNRLSNLETVCRACHLEEHREELMEIRRAKNSTPKLLKSGRWSRQHDSCVRCGLQTSPHVAKGLCNRCNVARYRKPTNKMT